MNWFNRGRFHPVWYIVYEFSYSYSQGYYLLVRFYSPADGIRGQQVLPPFKLSLHWCLDPTLIGSNWICLQYPDLELKK